MEILKKLSVENLIMLDMRDALVEGDDEQLNSIELEAIEIYKQMEYPTEEIYAKVQKLKDIAFEFAFGG